MGLFATTVRLVLLALLMNCASKTAMAKWRAPADGIIFSDQGECLNGKTKKVIDYNKDSRNTMCSDFSGFKGNLEKHFDELRKKGKKWEGSIPMMGAWFASTDIPCGTDFSEFNLSNSVFVGTTINQSKSAKNCAINMQGTNLSSANFQNAQFSGAINMKGANLSLANLKGARFNGIVDVTGADLTGADVSNVDLTHFVGLDKANTDGMIWNDKTTIFPKGFKLKPDQTDVPSEAVQEPEDADEIVSVPVEDIVSDEGLYGILDATVHAEKMDKLAKGGGVSPRLASPVVLNDHDQPSTKTVKGVIAGAKAKGTESPAVKAPVDATKPQ